jgi:hypothetical protein
MSEARLVAHGLLDFAMQRSRYCMRHARRTMNCR